MADQLSKRKSGPKIVKPQDGSPVECPQRMKRTYKIPDRITQDVIRSMRATQKQFDAIVALVKLPPELVRKVFVHSRRESVMFARTWIYYGLVKHRAAVLCAKCGGITNETTDGLCCACWMEVPSTDRTQAAYLHRTVDCAPSDRRDERLFSAAMSEVDAEVAQRKAQNCAPPERTFAQIAAEAEQRLLARSSYAEGREFDG
jgi:hypothetical protein